MGSNHSRLPRDLSSELPVKLLHQIFEIIDGRLHWRADRPAQHFRSEKHSKRYAQHVAGKAAGTDKASIGYRQIRINRPDGTYIFAYEHRIIFAMTHGAWPPVNRFVDHKTRNPLINDADQLRLADRFQNALNHSLEPKYTYFGVFPSKNGKRYIAVFRNKRIGTFDSEFEAAVARDRRIIALGLGDYARLNVLKAHNDNQEPKDITE